MKWYRWYRRLNRRQRVRLGARIAVQDHPVSLLLIGKWAVALTTEDVPDLDRDQFRRVVREATIKRVSTFRDEPQA